MAGIVAFYALIHLVPTDLAPALARWRDALRPGGRLLVAVHEGTAMLHLDTMLDRQVDLDFHFFSVDQKTALLTGAGILVTEVAMREPCPSIKAQTRRIYVIAVTPVANQIQI